MSLPSFPEKDKIPSREEVINQIISSIAMEELGLSHIINAEGEKLQYALGTIPGVPGPDEPMTMEALLKLNDSVHKTLDSTMMNQFFLKEKLVNALSASVMQGPAGPAGPQGPATIDVNPQVDDLDPGQKPFVKNEGSDTDAILKFGVPKGSVGATGPVGTILESYNTLAELEANHPTGKQGDAYLVGGDLYIWDDENRKWKKTGNLTGPVGTILDSFATLKDLIDKHPTGNQGDAYLVGAGDLYVWDGITKSWKKAGNLRGPAGSILEPNQELFGVTGATGGEKVTYEGSLALESDTLDITVETGPVIKIETRVGAIISVSSGRQFAINTANGTGGRHQVAMIGFGNGATIASDFDPIVLPAPLASAETVQTDFSIPVDGIITSMSAVYTAMSGGLAGVDTVITAQLFETRSVESGEFFAIPGAKVELGKITGSVVPSQVRQGIATGLSIPVKANTRLLMVFHSRTPSWTLWTEMTGYMSGAIEIK